MVQYRARKQAAVS